MPMILHIASRADWAAACATGAYRPASLQTEGFLHCSTAAQVIGSADRYFRGRRDLVLLCIDESRVAGALRSQLGFGASHAQETARRLFEPFEMVADWPW